MDRENSAKRKREEDELPAQPEDGIDLPAAKRLRNGDDNTDDMYNGDSHQPLNGALLSIVIS